MIATIVTGSGNRRRVFERERNSQQRITIRDAIIKHLGLSWPNDKPKQRPASKKRGKGKANAGWKRAMA